jgi:hypothetical protein
MARRNAETCTCADGRLSVYEVTGTGIDERRARTLAQALKIPPEKIFVRDGMAAFVDPAQYLAVPTVPVPDADVVRKLRDGDP